MNIIDALNWRYAVRQFSDNQIEPHQIEQLLEATRLSASSYGLQPYRLIVLKDRDIRSALLPYSMGQSKVLECSHLLIFAAQTQVDDAMVDRYIQAVAESRKLAASELQGFADHVKQVLGGMSPEARREWAHQQAYIALGTLLTTAAVMKIDSCPMTGFEKSAYDRVLGLQEMGLESTVICALGERHPEDRNAYLPKVRFDSSEWVISI